jgi:hypothetical protein
MKALTHDMYADLQPSFSDNGKWIVFATDRRNMSNEGLATHRFTHDIALLDMESGEVQVFDLFPNVNNLNPVFGPGDSIIYFLSDHDGFRNLYSYHLTNKQIVQHTSLYTGITGITLYAPAITISKTGKLVYSLYDNNDYIIYSANSNDLATIQVNQTVDSMQAAILPPVNRTKKSIVQEYLYTPFPTLPDSSMHRVPYRSKLQLDYLSNTGTGVSVGRYGTGLAGGVNAMFSDMLGNHQLFGAFSLNGQVIDAAGQFVYYNQKKRINWGIGYSHIPYYLGDEWITYDSINAGDKTQRVLSYNTDILRTFEEQFSILGAYPFSQTRRVEIGGSFSRYHYNMERFSTYYDSLGYLVGYDHKRNLPVPKGFNTGNIYLAWVGDNSQFGVASPLTGHRFRLEAGQYFGIVKAQEVLADYRRYIRLAPFSLAMRNMFYGRFGKDAQTGALPSLYLGYPWLIRGYEGQQFTGQNNNKASIMSINDLSGSRMYIANAELRLPLTGPERLSVIKSGKFFTELALFTDAGTAWGYAGGEEKRSKFIVSSGLSLRINFFGYMVIEPYYAIPWQNGGVKNASIGLNFLPGW